MYKLPATLFFLVAFYSLCQAQPFTLDDRIAPKELTLVDYKKDDTIRRGKINVTSVVQVKDTAYYFIKGFSMYSPAYFGLTTKADSGNIKIRLCKENWINPDREGETGSKGHWQEQFKTEGDFGIMVVIERKPARYTMVTWVGKEARDIGLTSAFKDGSTSTAKGDKKATGGKSDSSILLFGVIGLLVLICGFLFYKIKKQKK